MLNYVLLVETYKKYHLKHIFIFRYRDWYDETTWCFCFLDHRCNGASLAKYSMAALILPAVVLLTHLH